MVEQARRLSVGLPEPAQPAPGLPDHISEPGAGGAQALSHTRQRGNRAAPPTGRIDLSLLRDRRGRLETPNAGLTKALRQSAAMIPRRIDTGSCDEFMLWPAEKP